VKAVVFDCDGVLVDSELAWTRALRETLTSYGVSLANDRSRAMIGGSVPEAVAFMEHELGHRVDAEQIGRAIYASVLSSVARGISPMAGAIDLVASLDGTRPLAVASNGSRETVLASLSVAGIPDVFDVIVALGATTRPKPAPDLYLDACSLLGVAPFEAVAIEDSFRGATAAKVAGMSVVGVGTAPRLKEASDLVIPDLTDPCLAELLATRSSF
jgi:HAD superfamily hydrolase (TIGR01509 family)